MALNHVKLERLRVWAPVFSALVAFSTGTRAPCGAHFLAVVSGDAMSSERGETAAYWWTTEGGRAAVFGAEKAREAAQDVAGGGANEAGAIP